MGLRNTFGAETVNNTWKAGGASAGAAVALGMLLGKTEFGEWPDESVQENVLRLTKRTITVPCEALSNTRFARKQSFSRSSSRWLKGQGGWGL